jgi:3-deoxy-D-manno-octulosonate 8-phosphate phosphatase KdsC-like HAD superfamily phosphatase
VDSQTKITIALIEMTPERNRSIKRRIRDAQVSQFKKGKSEKIAKKSIQTNLLTQENEYGLLKFQN